MQKLNGKYIPDFVTIKFTQNCPQGNVGETKDLSYHDAISLITRGEAACLRCWDEPSSGPRAV